MTRTRSFGALRSARRAPADVRGGDHAMQILEDWRAGQGAGSRIRDQHLPVRFAGSRYAERLPRAVDAGVLRDTLERHVDLDNYVRGTVLRSNTSA